MLNRAGVFIIVHREIHHGKQAVDSGGLMLSEYIGSRGQKREHSSDMWSLFEGTLSARVAERV